MRELPADGTCGIDADLLECRVFSVGGINFDNEAGIGCVPDMAEIYWRGALAAITPRKFLSLTPSLDSGERPGTSEFLARTDGPLGSPFLIFKISERSGIVRVRGHEGRHRMLSIGRKHGFDTTVPVGVFVMEGHYRLKGRELDRDVMSRIAAGAMREDSPEYVPGPLFECAVWSHGNLDPEPESAPVKAMTPAHG